MFRIDVQTRVGEFDLRPTFEADSEFVVLFGPSGCGKSLTLQAIAGLLTPAHGRIELPGGLIAFDSDAKIDVPPQARSIGYVVQELALFPHMTVRQNIEFAINSWPRDRRQERVRDLVTMLALDGFEERRPRQLSGGQQQRVALARALAAEPSLLLLDEPFSALDSPLRLLLRRELADLRKRLDVTALFVTHDLSEAHALADRMVVYDDGATLQQGTRESVLRHPVSKRVAELVEARNLVPGRIEAYVEGVAVVRTPWFTARVRDSNTPIHGDVYVVARPEHIVVLRDGHEARNEGDGVVSAEIINEESMGNTHRLFMRAVAADAELGEPFVFEVDMPAHPYDVIGIASRREWRIAIDAEHISLVPRR